LNGRTIVVETLDDELAALNSIVEFIRSCENDPEVIAALTFEQVRAEARAYARNKSRRTPPSARLL
jgi:hypothetical protein